jgi:hypothetical protein
VAVRLWGWRLRACPGGGEGEWMSLGIRVWDAAYIRFWWAWANIVFWATFGLLYTLHCYNSGSPTGDGDLQNVPSPASPDGDGKLPVKLPAGTKITPIGSPNGGNPRRGSGIGAPLPSLIRLSKSK